MRLCPTLCRCVLVLVLVLVFVFVASALCTLTVRSAPGRVIKPVCLCSGGTLLRDTGCLKSAPLDLILFYSPLKMQKTHRICIRGSLMLWCHIGTISFRGFIRYLTVLLHNNRMLLLRSRSLLRIPSIKLSFCFPPFLMI